MKLVVGGSPQWSDVDVRVDSSVATVAELARALGAPAVGDAERDAGLTLDGLRAPGDLSLLEAGTHEGAEVHLERRGTTAASLGEATGPAHVGAVELCVLGGLDAGRRFPLGVGSHLVGRAAGASVTFAHATVSRQHCVIDVDPDGSLRLTDRSPGHTYVDGVAMTEPVLLGAETVVETGAVAWVVRPPLDEDRLTGTDRFRDVKQSGVINLNRPPRYASPGQPARIPAPKEPDKAHAAPFSLVAMIAPAALGIVMVIVEHNVIFLAMAGLTPLMAVGNWWETKHRSTKAFRGDNRRYATELKTLEAQLALAQATERTRRRSRTPDVAEAMRRASAPSIHLWERRPGDDDFGALAAGIGDPTWAPEMVQEGSAQALPSEVSERLSCFDRLISVPLEVNVADGGVVGVVGDRAAARAMARSLVVQAAVHHGPADLRMVVIAVAARRRRGTGLSGCPTPGTTAPAPRTGGCWPAPPSTPTRCSKGCWPAGRAPRRGPRSR